MRLLLSEIRFGEQKGIDVTRSFSQGLQRFPSFSLPGFWEALGKTEGILSKRFGRGIDGGCTDRARKQNVPGSAGDQSHYNMNRSKTKLAAVNAEDKTPGLRLPIDFVLVLASGKDKTPASGYLIGYGRTDEEGRVIGHHLYPQVGQAGLDGPKVICAGGCSFARWYAALLHHLSGVIVYPPNLYSYLGDTLAFFAWKDRT
jgi:hypothetical protein